MNLIFKPLAIFEQRIIGRSCIYALAVHRDKNIQGRAGRVKVGGNNRALKSDMITRGGVYYNKDSLLL